MKATLVPTVALVVACVANAVLAQEYQSPSYGYAVRPTPNGLTAIYHHASTAEEGWLRGQADVIRAYGDYWYSRSLGMINVEEARRRHTENRKLATETFFEMRKINAEARAQERPERASREELVRYAKEGAPKRLAPAQFDATFGLVTWPTILQQPEFYVERTAIDRLMAARTMTNSGAGSDNCRQVKALVSQLQQKLKERIGTLASMDYVAAQKFLTSLGYEAQQKPMVPGLAMR